MSTDDWSDISTAPKDRRISIKTLSGEVISHADWGLAFSRSSSTKRQTWRNCKGGPEIVNPTQWRNI